MKLRHLAMIAAFAATSHAWAGEFRYIDMNKVFNEYYQTLTKDEAIKAKREKAQAEVAKRSSELARITKDIDSAKATLNNVTDATMRTNYVDVIRDLQLSGAKKKAELDDYMKNEGAVLQKESADIRNELVKAISTELEKFAQTKPNVEAIIDVSGFSANLIPVVPYYDKKKDDTVEFLNVINKGHEADVKAMLEKRKAAAEEAKKADDPSERLKKLQESAKPEAAPAAPKAN